ARHGAAPGHRGRCELPARLPPPRRAGGPGRAAAASAGRPARARNGGDGLMVSREAGRGPEELREISVTVGCNRYAEGSALVRWGHTHVLATVTVDQRLPPHLRRQGERGGWLTAEYALLPRSTPERAQRERLYAGG